MFYFLPVKTQDGLSPIFLVSAIQAAPCLLPAVFLFRREWQECNIPRSLNRCGQHALVPGTIARDPAGQDFPPLGNIFFQARHILIIDGFHLVHTKTAYPLLTPAAPFAFQ